MSARVLRSRGPVLVVLAVALAAAVFAPAWGRGPHQKTPVKLESTQSTEYRILQGEKEMGRESVVKKTFGNNTVEFVIDATMSYTEGTGMKQHVELTLEEESFFPRVLHILKTITQPDGQTFEHSIDVDMVSNVAVVSSKLRNQLGSRRIVVPAGVALADQGVLGYFYQTLFWYDREVGGGQRFQWLDPITVNVYGGEIRFDSETTIAVLKKKTKVSMFRVERERLGPATLWVDKQGTIVRGEQGILVYELASKKSS